MSADPNELAPRDTQLITPGEFTEEIRAHADPSWTHVAISNDANKDNI